MKKMFLAFAFAASFVAAKAQDAGAAFGVKAGANFANLSTKVGDDSESSDMKVGYHVGAYANVSLGSTFSFQPELVLSAEGAKEDDAKLNLSYLNLPLLLQYNASGFIAETGPQVGFLLGAKAKEDDEDEDVKDSFKSTNLSWAIGLGYRTASGFGFGARYNLGLSNIAEDGGDDFKMKTNTIQVGISYTLGK